MPRDDAINGTACGTHWRATGQHIEYHSASSRLHIERLTKVSIGKVESQIIQEGIYNVRVENVLYNDVIAGDDRSRSDSDRDNESVIIKIVTAKYQAGRLAYWLILLSILYSFLFDLSSCPSNCSPSSPPESPS